MWDDETKFGVWDVFVQENDKKDEINSEIPKFENAQRNKTSILEMN